MTDTESLATGRWRDLLGPRHLGASTVLAGGVALYATNGFLTISLLPTAVSEIGGQRFYAWVTTVYLVGAVVAATTVYALLQRLGPRWSYLVGLGVFGIGSLGCAVAPNMEILLAGRTVQGAAGGLLAGLGYAVINTALPSTLWIRASALVSAMWGVGTLVGPTAGGLFAQLGLWRWAFGGLVILAAAMAVLVPIALPSRSAETGERNPRSRRIPVWSLLLLGSAALAVSVAGILHDGGATAALLAVAAVLVAAFLAVDRRAVAAVLPPSAFGSGPLKWIYLVQGALMAATMADMYVPLFGQRLAHLSPVAAGFLGAGLAIGWTVGEIASASLRDTRLIRRTVQAGPMVMASGLALGALSLHVVGPGPGLMAMWALALLIAGAGVGAAWPHLSAWAMSSVDDPAEGPAAAAAINTVQLICGAFGAGFAGMVVNLNESSDTSAASWLFASFAVLAGSATVAAVRAGGRPGPDRTAQ